MSTFGTDPCFRRVRGVLSTGSSPIDSLRWKQVGSKCAEQRVECSDGSNDAGRIESTVSVNGHLLGSGALKCQGYSWCSRS